MPDLKQKVIDHILYLKERDVDYARQAFKWYCEKLPWMNLKEEIKKVVGK